MVDRFDYYTQEAARKRAERRNFAIPNFFFQMFSFAY
jgi:hypothetical protein